MICSAAQIKLVSVCVLLFDKFCIKTQENEHSMATMSVYHQNGVAGQAINYTAAREEFTIVPPQYNTPIYEVSLRLR